MNRMHILADTSLFIFATSAALLLAMPGPTNALLMAAGAARGLGGALRLLVAALAGYATALAALLSLDDLAGTFRGEISLALRATAAILLLATAWRMWRAVGPSGGQGGQGQGRGRAQGQAPGAMHVFLLTLFNPKALILGFAIFPPVIAKGALASAAGLFAAVVLATGLGWIVAGAATRRLPGAPDIVVARLSSMVVAGFAGYFVVTIAAELMPLAGA